MKRLSLFSALLLLAGCSLLPRPHPPVDPTLPTECLPAVPWCNAGQTCSTPESPCKHNPTQDPKHCELAPACATPTCPACPAGSHCTDPAKGCVPDSDRPPAGTNCDGAPGPITGKTTMEHGQVVNEVMSELTGCSIGSDCLLGDTTQQQFLRAVVDRLRARGVCSGQHVPLHTDEIAVSDSPAGIREGGHVFMGPDNDGPAPEGGGKRKVVWFPGAARPSYYAGSAPPACPQGQMPRVVDGEVVGCDPVTDGCPAEPCPIRTWTRETLPPGWSESQIGQPAYEVKAKRHTMGNGDSTAVVVRQEPHCRAIGMSPDETGQLRASCPVRPDGHPERVAVENWLLFGGPTRDACARFGSDGACVEAGDPKSCSPNNTDNPAAFLFGTGKCRMCNATRTACSHWF